MTMIEISPIAQDLLCFFGMMLVALSAFSLAYARWRLIRQHVGISAIIFWITIFWNLLLAEFIYQVHGTSLAWKWGIEKWPVTCCVLITVALAVANSVLLQAKVRWRMTHITVASIKEGFDGLPSGIVIYDYEGNCVLVNSQMNQLCHELMGHAVLNGKELYEQVAGRNMQMDYEGRKYQFQLHELELEGNILHELRADDVTELYEKARELEIGNERLKQMARKMKKYGKMIDETVHQQEILQAKIRIHDEMNELLLRTSNALDSETDQQEWAKILNVWQNIALVLQQEGAAQNICNTISDLQTLAKMVGVRLELEGVIPTKDTAALELFSILTREALVNAAKHGEAETLFAEIQDADGWYRVRYRNDGQIPLERVVEGGGLTALRERLESIGGRMQMIVEPEFQLIIEFPKGDKQDEI